MSTFCCYDKLDLSWIVVLLPETAHDNIGQFINRFVINNKAAQFGLFDQVFSEMFTF